MGCSSSTPAKASGSDGDVTGLALIPAFTAKAVGVEDLDETFEKSTNITNVLSELNNAFVVRLRPSPRPSELSHLACEPILPGHPCLRPWSRLCAPPSRPPSLSLPMRGGRSRSSWRRS